MLLLFPYLLVLKACHCWLWHSVMSFVKHFQWAVDYLNSSLRALLEINWLLVKSSLLRQGRSVVSDYAVTTDRDLKSLSLSLFWILVWAVYNLTFCKRLRLHSGGFNKQFNNLLNWPSVECMLWRFKYCCEIVH